MAVSRHPHSGLSRMKVRWNSSKATFTEYEGSAKTRFRYSRGAGTRNVSRSAAYCQIKCLNAGWRLRTRPKCLIPVRLSQTVEPDKTRWRRIGAMKFLSLLAHHLFHQFHSAKACIVIQPLSSVNRTPVLFSFSISTSRFWNALRSTELPELRSPSATHGVLSSSEIPPRGQARYSSISARTRDARVSLRIFAKCTGGDEIDIDKRPLFAYFTAKSIYC